jgi:transcriptional regulator with XRE-family HTH domain
MTGQEFRELRKLLGLRDKHLLRLFGMRSIGMLRHYERKGLKEVPVLFEIFVNYVNRYGFGQAMKEFGRRFKIED